jgi:ribonuclease HI
MEKISIYTDGGSRNNPGKAAIGIVILDKDKNKLIETGKYLGIATNNQAEYKAVIKALKIAKKFSDNVVLYSDSQLIVMQLKGKYKVKNKNLINLFNKVKKLENNYDEVEYKHVKRDNKYIRLADKIVNKILDKHKK